MLSVRLDDEDDFFFSRREYSRFIIEWLEYCNIKKDMKN